MAKRRCPFDEDLSPQMKTHIGELEVLKQDENSMNNVYKKTLQALKDGSKLYPFGKGNSNVTVKMPLEVCGCCRYIDSRKPCRCSYCDQIMCNLCLVPCSKCCESFCQNCSLTVYDTDEQNMCMSCYK
ncbi:uncharacterized protein LOC107980927 isoform X1 [Nasonia vitripennis]|uniref:Apoptosis regulatory protein Siva n=1 Tax=Nasonia vitripennis TaxID=7425 RepID=A0A7M7T6N5_NASVI|nr:uncharacterized protein LOC107980927 isoform X1 [Nasonia vitripennis]